MGGCPGPAEWVTHKDKSSSVPQARAPWVSHLGSTARKAQPKVCRVRSFLALPPRGQGARGKVFRACVRPGGLTRQPMGQPITQRKPLAQVSLFPTWPAPQPTGRSRSSTGAGGDDHDDSDTSSPGAALQGPRPLGGFGGRGPIFDPGTQGFSGWRRSWEPWPGASQKEAMEQLGQAGPWHGRQRSLVATGAHGPNVAVPSRTTDPQA